MGASAQSTSAPITDIYRTKSGRSVGFVRGETLDAGTVEALLMRREPDASQIAAGVRPQAALVDALALGTIQFSYDSANLLNDSLRTLDAVCAAFEDPGLAHLQVSLVGHASSEGSDSYNLELSSRRAGAAAAYLAGCLGSKRLRSAGAGEGDPIVGISTVDARQRRVELSIAED